MQTPPKYVKLNTTIRKKTIKNAIREGDFNLLLSETILIDLDLLASRHITPIVTESRPYGKVYFPGLSSRWMWAGGVTEAGRLRFLGSYGLSFRTSFF